VIDKLLRAKAVVGIGAAVLLASGVAFAAGEGGSRPAVSQDEVSSTSTSVDQSSTSTSLDDASTTSTVESTSTTAAPNGSTTTTEAEHEHPENHGACVSQAAHDTPPGPDHGKAVSDVAHSDCGKNTTASSEPNENENENENEAPEQENEQHGSQSGDHGNSGSDHGGGHGGPGQD
jgi:hypothetical protein